MNISDFFPIWNKLTDKEKKMIEDNAVLTTVKAGENVHDSARECTGLLLVREGQLRAFILSEEGREVTLYRLLEGDICLFSAACVMHSVSFDITVNAEKDTSFWLIPTDVYASLMEKSVAVSNYTNEIMADRMSEVMWLLEQIMWQSFDRRLAAFLLEESALQESNSVKMTHETIAKHMGTAREVVTRMLKYFQEEGIISFSRGTITISDESKLRNR